MAWLAVHSYQSVVAFLSVLSFHLFIPLLLSHVSDELQLISKGHYVPESLSESQILEVQI